MRSQDQYYELINNLEQQFAQKTAKDNSLDVTCIPSTRQIAELAAEIRKLIFADYFYNQLNYKNWHTEILQKLQQVRIELQKQIWLCLCCHANDQQTHDKLNEQAYTLSCEFMQKIPQIRALLNSDADAANSGDPACETPYLPILCYPSLICLTHHRVAHELYQMNIPLLPRIINEIAHTLTGIDIHPGAAIGSHCFIDHGTGVVIGETSIIGNNVRIYHGVTLGAKSFPTDEHGVTIRGIKRHPVIGNNVIIYANAVILGRVHIGDHSIIGGNVWLTHSVPEHSNIYINKSCAIATTNQN